MEALALVGFLFIEAWRCNWESVATEGAVNFTGRWGRSISQSSIRDLVFLNREINTPTRELGYDNTDFETSFLKWNSWIH
jgi:hypothetical protein